MAKKYLDDNGLLYFWGKLKATFALISHTHTKSQITDFPTSMPPTSHTHGNITNAGALQSTDITIATGDKIVVTDGSNSSKVARTSLAFDTATEGTDKKALTQAGTWQTFLTSADVPEGASASSTTPKALGADNHPNGYVGAETSFARGDHVHPLSPVFTGSNGTGDGSVGLVPAPSQSGSPAKSYKFLGSNAKWAYVKPEFRQPTTGEEAGKLTTKLSYTYEDNTTGGTVTAVVPEATTSSNGAMSSADKTKLDGIREGANAKGSIVTKTSSYPSDAVLNLYDASTGEYSDFRVYSTQEMDTMFSGATTILNSKVDKVEGKGLSTNDYTDADKTKLDGIESGAEANVLEGVQVNGTDLTIDANKKVNIPLASSTKNGVIKIEAAGDPVRPSVRITCGYTPSYVTATDIIVPLVRTKGDGTISAQFLPEASTTVKGAMSSADKTKLDSITMTNGVIDSSVLPSFVDDVIEAYARTNQTELGSTWLATGSATGTVITPETGKIYVLMNDSTSYSANSQFRWGGTAYVKLSDGGVSAITNAEIDTIVAS